MSTEDASSSGGGRRKGPTTVARAYFQALSDHDVDAAAALWKPGSFDRAIGVFELQVPSREYSQWFGGLIAAVPDIRFDVVSITAQKETAASQIRVHGTFNGTGRFEGLVPNGAALDIESCDVLTVRDGLIVGLDAYLNGAELARQLGVLPPQGSLAERGMTGAFNARTAARDLVTRLRDR